MAVKLEEKFPLNFVSRLYLNEELSDVRIQVGQTSIPAHKTILAASCDFFKLYFGNHREHEPSVIPFHERNEHHVKLVLKFIYTGTVDLTDYADDEVIEVLTFCLYLKLEQLVDHLLGFIRGFTITTKNIAKLLNIVDQYEVIDLTTKCWDFLDNNLEEVIDDNELFLEFSYNVLLKIIERYSKQLNISSAVSFWLQRHPKADVKCFPMVNLVSESESDCSRSKFESSLLLHLKSESETGDSELKLERSLPLKRKCENTENNMDVIIKKEEFSESEDESCLSEPKIEKVFSKRFEDRNWTEVKHSQLYTFHEKGEILLFQLNEIFDLNCIKFQLLDDILRLYSFQLAVGETRSKLHVVREYCKNVVYASVVEVMFRAMKVKFIAIKSFRDSLCRLQLYLSTFQFSFDVNNHHLSIPKHNVAHWSPVGEQYLSKFRVVKDIRSDNRIVFVLRYPCHISSLAIEFRNEYKREITVSISQRFNGFWISVARGVLCSFKTQRIPLDENLLVSFVMIEGEGVTRYVRAIRCPDT